jgi:hypothetical protein
VNVNQNDRNTTKPKMATARIIRQMTSDFEKRGKLGYFLYSRSKPHKKLLTVGIREDNKTLGVGTNTFSVYS